MRELLKKIAYFIGTVVGYTEGKAKNTKMLIKFVYLKLRVKYLLKKLDWVRFVKKVKDKISHIKYKIKDRGGFYLYYTKKLYEDAKNP